MFHRNLQDPNGICHGIMEAPIALVLRVLEHGKVIGTIRDDLPSSLLLEAVMALAMAVDRWAVENAKSFSAEAFERFNEKVFEMFMRILAAES